MQELTPVQQTKYDKVIKSIHQMHKANINTTSVIEDLDELVESLLDAPADPVEEPVISKQDKKQLNKKLNKKLQDILNNGAKVIVINNKIDAIKAEYNVNDQDIEIALIIKKIIENDHIYYNGEPYYFETTMTFDYATKEIVLFNLINACFTIGCRKEEIVRLPILEYKKTYWLKKDKSE